MGIRVDETPSAHVFLHKVQCTQPEPGRDGGRPQARFWAALKSAARRMRRQRRTPAAAGRGFPGRYGSGSRVWNEKQQKSRLSVSELAMKLEQK